MITPETESIKIEQSQLGLLHDLSAQLGEDTNSYLDHTFGFTSWIGRRVSMAGCNNMLISVVCLQDGEPFVETLHSIESYVRQVDEHIALGIINQAEMEAVLGTQVEEVTSVIVPKVYRKGIADFSEHYQVESSTSIRTVSSLRHHLVLESMAGKIIAYSEVGQDGIAYDLVPLDVPQGL